MVTVEKQSVRVSGYLTVTVRSRVSKSEKNTPDGSKKEYLSYYLPLLKEDLTSKGLAEGDRVTLGIIKIEKAPEIPVPAVS